MGEKKLETCTYEERTINRSRQKTSSRRVASLQNITFPSTFQQCVNHMKGALQRGEVRYVVTYTCSQQSVALTRLEFSIVALTESIMTNTTRKSQHLTQQNARVNIYHLSLEPNGFPSEVCRRESFTQEALGGTFMKKCHGNCRGQSCCGPQFDARGLRRKLSLNEDLDSLDLWDVKPGLVLRYRDGRGCSSVSAGRRGVSRWCW